MALKRAVFHLAHFVGEVKHAAMLDTALLHCDFRVEPIPPSLMVDADKDLLFSALGNILKNAFKFSGRKAVGTLSVDDTSDRARVKAKDSGPGLDADAVRDMFFPFAPGGSNKSGFGLGLSIELSSVKANGGTLTAESAPGHGCAFVI